MNITDGADLIHREKMAVANYKFLAALWDSHTPILRRLGAKPPVAKYRIYKYGGRRTMRKLASVEAVKPIRTPSRPPAHSGILIHRVADAFGLPVDALSGKCRNKAVVAARSVVARLLRERNAAVYTYPMIARSMGRSDHSSAIYWHKMYPVFAKQFPDVERVYLAMGGTNAA